MAIEVVLTLRLVFHLALRQVEGFPRSVLRLLGMEIAVPDHSTLSRRGRGFAGRQPRAVRHDSPVHVVLDSTGTGSVTRNGTPGVWASCVCPALGG
jgi:hypothetical protein